MTPDQKRIFESRSNPAILQLWWALQPLKSVVRFMNTGAHPDDETTAMLAALAFRDGINLSYACSTRGEGGQNDIGTEAGADLGALRTAEMERAASVLGMRLYWHSESAEDTITDFGFSKSGVETLKKWGHERTLRRFVEIVRQDRPDIICPTFLDVPGQHGHHRAMTALAHEVFEVAADPAYVTEGLNPWAVSKLYLPAWSGAGTSYDDDLPPPAATLTIPGKDTDPVSGWGWGLIGEHSRVYHLTQGMGRWASATTRRDWDLHLAARRTEGDDLTIASGFPATLESLARLDGTEDMAANLRRAQTAVNEALARFPDRTAVSLALQEGLRAIQASMATSPEQTSGRIRHRLADKERQFSRALRVALGVFGHAEPEHHWVLQGGKCKLSTSVDRGCADAANVEPWPEVGWTIDGAVLHATRKAPLPTGFRSAFDPLDPPAPALALRYRIGDIEAEDRIAFDGAPITLPERSVTLSDTRGVVNLRTENRSVELKLSGITPRNGTVSVDVPAGWKSMVDGSALRVVAPEDATPGLYGFPVLIDGSPAQSTRRIEYDHIARTARSVATVVTVRVLSVAVPTSRIGYIGGGNDRVAHWLSAIGGNVTDLSRGNLDASTLSQFDSIVVGIFAMKSAPGLSEALEVLHDWVRDGGTLVTLYHRPWDNWDTERTPLYPLEIGQPSLRWRVTDRTAKVSHMVPAHPVLNTPNKVDSETWEGWAKERGLYFAKSWDPAYVPLLEMADPEEDPHRGALLVADSGNGRHVHTSLILHHQMECLVPGGFELMCNVIAPRQ